MTLESRTEYKRTFSLREFYDAAVLLPPAIAALSANRRRGLMDGRAVERIMLAVTEVNGCPACSWAHTRMALREGMSGEEISALMARLGGRPYADSSLWYEVGMQVAGALVLPVALAHGLVRWASGAPDARFANDLRTHPIVSKPAPGLRSMSGQLPLKMR
ncbi:MAG: carboxymuconolactone decarboxylase family protein [Actinomycetota bacterium]